MRMSEKCRNNNNNNNNNSDSPLTSRHTDGGNNWHLTKTWRSISSILKWNLGKIGQKKLHYYFDSKTEYSDEN